jgi:hypothetical protein
LLYNYKQYFSILLQAVVDADCRIIAVDIGAEGRLCDSANVRSSSLFRMFESGCLNIPPEREIPGTNIKIPFVLVGDGGYPLLNYLMRPFGQGNADDMKRVYNYRLSRARRSVECTFGIMASQWRILQKAIQTNMDTAISTTNAVYILHNFLMIRERPQLPQEERDLNFQSGMYDSCAQNSRRPQYRFAKRALQTRDILLNYFNGIGSVPWQMNYAYSKTLLEAIICRASSKESIRCSY